MTHDPIRTIPVASKKRPSDDQAAVSAFVNREVHYCISSLVHTLAQGVGRPRLKGHDLLTDLSDQAEALAAPVPDYESAAREAGWKSPVVTIAPKWFRPAVGDERLEAPTVYAEIAQEACELDDIEPHEREVYEHWIVSDWLADKLIEKGEKVDKNFAGMTVWARTTTGQAISMDSVIEEIFDELHSDKAEG